MLQPGVGFPAGPLKLAGVILTIDGDDYTITTPRGICYAPYDCRVTSHDPLLN